ncbi:ATP-binding protein [Breoghania sp.]|uniref:hybrid sensor histidine kinase/response regulator n=1 Tax=Breoghania sp. TaxID=2065378 RepID=UPI002606F5ED|nr:ATP-binding protein [Breoghania sp.]MDJ0932764.1 response regulator [Breoghania sp.]
MKKAETGSVDTTQTGEEESATALALAVIVHDIRTPLGAVSATADLLADTDLDMHQRRYVETLQQAATALNDLATELLDQAGEVPTEPSRSSTWIPVETLSSLAALFKPLADEKHVRLQLELGMGLDEVAMGDAHAVRRILTNLIDNAIKFTGKAAKGKRAGKTSGSVGTVYIAASLSGEEAQRLIVSVSDTGPGIAADELRGLFLPYRQGASGQRLRSGSGLGLWISRTLARRLGGTLEVESQLGHGTCFTLDVPCAPAEPGAEIATADGPEASEVEETTISRVRKAPVLKVLVVDDNAVNRLLVTTFLDSFGMAFKAVDSGKVALAAVGTESFDVVVMDLQMPGMDGVETALRLREMPEVADLPIVALTAGMKPADTARSRRARFSRVLGKPFAPADLFAALTSAAKKDGEDG